MGRSDIGLNVMMPVPKQGGVNLIFSKVTFFVPKSRSQHVANIMRQIVKHVLIVPEVMNCEKDAGLDVTKSLVFPFFEHSCLVFIFTTSSAALAQ